jgi:predicted exporter
MPLPWRRRLFFLLLPLFLAGVFLNTRIETDLNTFFTATDSEDTALLAGFLQSGELSRRYLITVEGRTDAGPLAEALVRRLAEAPEVERVWRADRPPGEWIAAVQNYAPYHARIYSLQAADDEAAPFGPDGLRRRAEALKQALLSPEGGFVKQIARDDPLLLSLSGFKGLQGRLRSPADQAVGLILQARAPALDTEAQSRLQDILRTRFDELNRAEGGTFRLDMTGVPVFTVAAHDRINRDVVLISAVSSVGLVLVFLLLFRSFAALHWVLLIVAASYGAGTLATSLAFGSAHSLTLALGSTLCGVCLDYPIHVLAHASQHRGERAETVVRGIWPSLAVGALTTVVGYGALGFTGFPGFQQIAVFAGVAIAAALALTRWVLPALLEKTVLSPPEVRGLDGWIAFCRRRRKASLALLAGGVCGAAVVLPGVTWMTDLQSLTLDMGELRQRDQGIRARFGDIEPGRFVLVQGPDLETALQRSEAAERRLRKLKAAGGLGEFFGVYPWLVSERLQRANAEAYDRALNPAFRTEWRTALTAAGLSVARLGNLAPAAATPLKAEEVLASEVRHILAGQIVRRDDGVALVVWLGAHRPEAVRDALADLPGVRYFSQRDLLNGLAEQYRDRSLDMLGYGLLIIYLALWLRYRRADKALLSLLPALLSALFIFAAWAALGQAVSFLHVMCLLLAVSICEDYGIFFLDNGGADIRVTYQAIAASMLTTLVSFAALGLAENPVLRTVAVAVTLGLIMGFLLCPLVIPSGGAAPEGRRP